MAVSALPFILGKPFHLESKQYIIHLWVYVQFTDKERSLFNTQCKTVVLLDWIKVKCGCERGGRCPEHVKVSLSNLFSVILLEKRTSSGRSCDCIVKTGAS